MGQNMSRPLKCGNAVYNRRKKKNMTDIERESRKDRIYSYMTSSTYVPLKESELAIVLDVPEQERNMLRNVLEELETEGRIYRTKKGRYCGVGTKGLTVAGKLSCNARGGFGFVIPDSDSEGDIFIPAEKLGNAYDGDRVLVRIDRRESRQGHREGHITGIIERGNNLIVGVITGFKGKTYRVRADRREFFEQIRVSGADLNGAKAGDRVAVRIKEYNSKGRPVGEVETVLGNAESVESCLNGLLSEYRIQSHFPKAVLEEADSMPDKVSPSEMENREDLRNKLIFTIDGDDSKDFDDAVSLEKTDDGNYLLGVHIADVTHYVKEDTQLCREALKRGTSVYMPHRVIPMLPKRLSNGICSLNPDVDRLTLSVFMEIDKDGNIKNHRITEAVIHSAARMTYANVNKILDGDTKLREKYSELVEVLEEMDSLSDILSARRRERGAIDFDFPETKVVCGADAEPVDVLIEERGRSHRLIESFMLAANETVAEAAYWAELPFVYRVHDAPSYDKLVSFNEFVKNFGYSLKGKIDPETIHPMDLQRIAEQAKGTAEELMISKVMLQSLMKACYRDTNNGHFGLAARYYCHFTSPIRRFPDLMIHRVLKDFINGRLDESRYNRYISEVRVVSEQSSDREIAAERAERDADDILKTAYMRSYLGESFDAVVSSVTSFGIFAMLENSCEGLIRCENISGDYYEYNESTHILKGRRRGREFRIGDRIRVTVAACNVLMRRIDFVLEGDDNDNILKRLQKRAESDDKHSPDKKKSSGKKHKRGKKRERKI